MRPDGTGDENNWDSGTYSSVNDQSETTYLEATGTAWKEALFSTADHSAGSGTINWVKVHIRYKEELTGICSGHSNVRTSMKSGTTESDGTPVVCSTSWAETCTEYTTNPNTGSAWT